MKRQVIATDGAPAAIGPYSQAVACGELVFCSGQIALDPQSGQLVADDVASEARQALRNLGAVLRAAGSDFGQVLKCTVFLTDLRDFAVVNEVYGELFAAQPPARACVQVAALPRGARVEVEAIALRSAG
jgi:2-iminobutanoate/2-iminopropanoate deaminase